MLKIAEYNKKTGKKIELKELEKYGFNTFYSEHKKCVYAVKDIYVDRPNKITPNWYRIGVDEVNRIFRKSKFRPGKTLLAVRVTKNDIDNLIKDGYIEKVEE